jgi:hypothetical protein
MTHFEFLTVALSFVLGLAVTVLLTSIVTAFRARRTTRMSWLPLTWAAYVLVIQFDVWWEIYGLAAMEQWSVGAFILLLLVALLLFAAGALVLPTPGGDYPKDLKQYFDQDGRWGVAVVGSFQMLSIIANTALFDFPLLGYMNIWNLAAMLLITMVVVATHGAIRGALTIAFGLWLATYLWVFVPVTY